MASSVLAFEHDMKLWLQLMQEDTGYHQPHTVSGYPMSFDQTLRPGGTCRAFGATYRGAAVVAKLDICGCCKTSKPEKVMIPNADLVWWAPLIGMDLTSSVVLRSSVGRDARP